VFRFNASHAPRDQQLHEADLDRADLLSGARAGAGRGRFHASPMSVRLRWRDL
jgi:hypothetical protein